MQLNYLISWGVSKISYKTCKNCETYDHCTWSEYQTVCKYWQGWRDPKQSVPNKNIDVLLKINLDEMDFVAEGYYRLETNDFYVYTVGLLEPNQVTGWRTIPE